MTIEIHPQAHIITDDYTTRSCKVLYETPDGQSHEKVIWFKMASQHALVPDNDCDAYLLSMIMEAMALGQNIKIHGSVSAELLSNLIEFQGAWAKWCPGLYTVVEIEADTIRRNEMAKDAAICAFSGGVDATFSVWAHTQKKLSHRSQDLAACVLVHGFDIPLDATNEYKNAYDRSADTLQDLGLDLLSIQTNVKDISTVNWHHAFSCLLVATLSNFKSMAGTCVVGSSSPYDALVIPWGSSPITDHLFSSGQFKVLHDGATHHRTEKVAVISDWDKGCHNLRVCWQGEAKDKNCGVCEKCLRTQLNFIAINKDIPSCFPKGDLIKDIRAIELTNDFIVSDWKQIVDAMQRNNVDQHLIQDVKKHIGKKPLKKLLFPKGSMRHRFIKPLYDKIKAL